MKLLGNTAILAPHKNTQTGSGILLSPKYMDDRMQWTVVAVGSGRRLKDGTRLRPEIVAGQRCLYNLGLSGTKHAFDDRTILVDVKDILMVWQ